MDTLLYFVILFVLFMAVWFVSLMISRAISKKRLRGFREYIQQNLSDFDTEKVEQLFAKQNSKQVRPDIMLLMDDDKQKIILIQDSKITGITHTDYDFIELVEVSSSNQIISRGFLPKTHSYEETLHLSFSDGASFQLILENISNKTGSDKGADLVRDIFSPWHHKLDQIIKDKTVNNS
jgi:hypothetical protein